MFPGCEYTLEMQRVAALGWRVLDRAAIQTAVFHAFVTHLGWPVDTVFRSGDRLHSAEYMNDLFNAELMAMVVSDGDDWSETEGGATSGRPGDNLKLNVNFHVPPPPHGPPPHWKRS